MAARQPHFTSQSPEPKAPEMEFGAGRAMRPHRGRTAIFGDADSPDCDWDIRDVRNLFAPIDAHVSR
jgi:hypothetical protein